MNNNIKLTLLLLVIALILGFGIAKGYYFDEDRYQFSRQSFGIGKEWVEIAPPKPIECDLTYQRLVLNILTPYEIESSCMGCPKIKLKDGTSPQIECVLNTQRVLQVFISAPQNRSSRKRAAK